MSCAKALKNTDLPENLSQKEYSLNELKKILLLLNLSVAQIDSSLSEGDGSVNTLVESFELMQARIEAIEAVAHRLEMVSDTSKDDLQHLADSKASLLTESQILTDKMNSAVIAFQFYDRLSQRLSHVSESLSGLADLVSDQACFTKESEWQTLRKNIENSCSMEEEYLLFDLVFNQHKTAAEAMEIMTHRQAEAAQTEDDDIFF